MAEGENKRAILLLGFLLSFEKADEEVRNEAKRLIGESKAKLPAKEVEKALAEGKRRKLEEVIKEILEKGLN